MSSNLMQIMSMKLHVKYAALFLHTLSWFYYVSIVEGIAPSVPKITLNKQYHY